MITDSKPNVILVVMDTARISDVNKIYNKNKMSALGRLAEEGSNFCNAISASPWTLPSHGSLFTGMYPSRHGAHANHKKLEGELTTLAELLHNKGFETVAVSNNTWISEEFGFDSGFETFHKTWQYVQSDTDLGKIAREEEGVDKLREVAKAAVAGNPIVNLVNAIYGKYFRKNGDDGAKRTNQWISEWLATRNDARPFFLFVNYLEPHLEYRPPQEHAECHLPEGVSYEEAMAVSQDAWGYIAGNVDQTEKDFEILRALYRAEIAYLDERIVEVQDMLKDAGNWNDTIFIVTSDHGENIGEHGLMDHQYALYETLLHVPLLIRGGPFKNAQVNDLVQLVDLPPTILDALDIEAPETRQQFQGVSFHPDADETREVAIAEYVAPQPSMEALEKRVGQLPDDVREYDRSLRMIRTDQYKYIRGSDGLRELYDHRTDPGEADDIFEDEPNVAGELDARLDEWLNSFEQADIKGVATMDDATKARLEDLGYLQ